MAILTTIFAGRELCMDTWKLVVDSSLLVSDVSRLTIVNLLCLQSQRTLWLQLSPPDRDFFPLIARLMALHKYGKASWIS
jgi:hypothetical protein